MDLEESLLVVGVEAAEVFELSTFGSQTEMRLWHKFFVKVEVRYQIGCQVDRGDCQEPIRSVLPMLPHLLKQLTFLADEVSQRNKRQDSTSSEVGPRVFALKANILPHLMLQIVTNLSLVSEGQLKEFFEGSFV
jgi:hypothetical protein